MDHELLLVGCPTWNTGGYPKAGTDWDDLYYEDDGLPRSTSRGRRSRCLGAATRSATAATSATRSMNWWRPASRNAQTASATCRPPVTATRTRRRCEGMCPAAARDQVNEGDKTEARLSSGSTSWRAKHLRRRRHGGPSTRARRRRAGTGTGPRRPAPAPAAAAVGAAPEPAVVDAVRDCYRTSAPTRRSPTSSRTRTSCSCRRLSTTATTSVAQDPGTRGRRAGGARRRARRGPRADGEPPAKLDGGALATVRSVDVIVKDTPAARADRARRARDVLTVCGGPVRVGAPARQRRKRHPHKKRRLYTVVGAGRAARAVRARSRCYVQLLHTIPGLAAPPRGHGQIHGPTLRPKADWS